jgi:hypothetical protein
MTKKTNKIKQVDQDEPMKVQYDKTIKMFLSDNRIIALTTQDNDYVKKLNSFGTHIEISISPYQLIEAINLLIENEDLEESLFPQIKLRIGSYSDNNNPFGFPLQIYTNKRKSDVVLIAPIHTEEEVNNQKKVPSLFRD